MGCYYCNPIDEGAQTSLIPFNIGWFVLPQCHICNTIFPPFAWTAFTTCFHPSAYSFVNIPPQPGKQFPLTETGEHSVKIKPNEAL